MAIIPGICGPANRPCKISHSSTYPNQIGIYPRSFLPSSTAIWHAVFASQFPPQNQPDLTGFGAIGAGLIPGLQIGGGFEGIVGPAVHSFQSHHYVIFARTANRLNIPYVLTETDITNINALGALEINVGEYIFEAISATTIPVDFNLELTEQELVELKENKECSIGCSAENIEDRKFRKLFEQKIDNNRLLGVVVNKLGIEYRLDNGTNKSKLGLDQSGIGGLNNASYRDGTSKKLEVQISDNESTLKIGDTLYLSYVAVKEHYLRQRVNITWQIIDTGTVTECVSLVLGYNIVHYRFYEWEMEAEPGELPTRLSGWRAVESFNSNVNFVAPLNINGQTVLADFAIGNPDVLGTRTFDILPGKISISQLQTYMDNRSGLPIISIDLNNLIPQGGVFHKNTSNLSLAEWFQRNEFNKYLNQKNASSHVFFNVHPKALRKRDVDKFGIERYLAIEIENDIKSGKISSFPFMDDPDVDNPTLGSNEFLSASNTIFAPVQPVTSYGGNFESVCASIGSFPTNPAPGINTYHSFESNKIKERFDANTRVLVERNFGTNATILNPRLITIEGSGGISGSITCIADPLKEFQFTSHVNSDTFIIYNAFNTGYTNEATRSLTFRPDLPSPPFKENNNPQVNQFESLLGYSGMVGDIPGFQPGRGVAIVSNSNNLLFQTTDSELLKQRIPFLSDLQIEEIPLSISGNSLIINVLTNTYYGSLNILYNMNEEGFSKDEKAMLLVKTGDVADGLIDNIVIRPIRGNPSELQIDCRWLRGSSFELIGDRVSDMNIEFISLRGLNSDKIHDFLNNSGLLFSSDVVSLTEDQHSNLYVFFNDTDGGISAVATNDYGSNWYYYYGIIEKIGVIESKDPFVVTNFKSDNCYVFFRFGGKILCKKITFQLFDFKDANLIQRFSDIFVSGTNEQIPIENKSIYSDKGKNLRRSVLSYVAAGDLTDEVFLEIVGKVPGQPMFSPNEIRNVEGKEVSVRKNPVAIGSSTAFPNADIENIFFSAYRKDNGEMRLWFLSSVEEFENNGMQCHFSLDDGTTWYDLWEFLENSYNRLRIDPVKNTQFIDRTAPNTPPATIKGSDPQESNQNAIFGINVHWSRLKKHKRVISEGSVDINSESQVLEISSPYVFYQSTTDTVFLFYIYQGMLLCKVFNDSVLNSKMDIIKDIIERQTRSHFIDGSLLNSDIQEEIHGFINEETEEIMSDGNIIFKYPFTFKNFTNDRVLSDQRICAFSLPTGQVRTFYKHADSINLKSALWTGSEWWTEDFLRNPNNLENMALPNTTGFTHVIGGFGGTGF